jgi:hypothetical protein
VLARERAVVLFSERFGRIREQDTIACTGAMLRFGQERSKVKTALAAEPCRAPHCNCTTPGSASSLQEFQGHTITPKG